MPSSVGSRPTVVITTDQNTTSSAASTRFTSVHLPSAAERLPMEILEIICEHHFGHKALTIHLSTHLTPSSKNKLTIDWRDCSPVFLISKSFRAAAKSMLRYVRITLDVQSFFRTNIKAPSLITALSAFPILRRACTRLIKGEGQLHVLSYELFAVLPRLRHIETRDHTYCRGLACYLSSSHPNFDECLYQGVLGSTTWKLDRLRYLMRHVPRQFNLDVSFVLDFLVCVNGINADKQSERPSSAAVISGLQVSDNARMGNKPRLSFSTTASNHSKPRHETDAATIISRNTTAVRMGSHAKLRFIYFFNKAKRGLEVSCEWLMPVAGVKGGIQSSSTFPDAREAIHAHQYCIQLQKRGEIPAPERYDPETGWLRYCKRNC